MKEDKQKICDLLLPVLRETSNLCDLVSLEYYRLTDYEERVIATFANGHPKNVNVSLDSGTAMIKDIIDQIV